MGNIDAMLCLKALKINRIFQMKFNIQAAGISEEDIHQQLRINMGFIGRKEGLAYAVCLIEKLGRSQCLPESES
jgi:2C-methyl-D-erythritol 2,4-cyclodiphosphate synthase